MSITRRGLLKLFGLGAAAAALPVLAGARSKYGTVVFTRVDVDGSGTLVTGSARQEVSWTPVPGPVAFTEFVRDGNGGFIAVGTDGSTATSQDSGVTWTREI